MVDPLELPHLFCFICLHGSVLSSVVSVMPCLGLQWNTLDLSTTHGPHCDRCAVLQMDVTCRLVPCAIDEQSAHFSISLCSSHTLMITYGCEGANRPSEDVVSRLPVEFVCQAEAASLADSLGPLMSVSLQNIFQGVSFALGDDVFD